MFWSFFICFCETREKEPEGTVEWTRETVSIPVKLLLILPLYTKVRPEKEYHYWYRKLILVGHKVVFSSSSPMENPLKFISP